MNCFLLSVAALALCQTDAQPGAVKELEAAQTRQQTPERQFDFWLGDWEVKNAKGEPVGRNTITRVEQGAGLLEHWSSSTGGTGTSISYHDPIQKIWVQVWMTGFKGALTARGLWSEGSMLLSSRDGDGRLISRTRWTPQTDGRVRQHWQKSNDDGASWSTAFDGYYSRVPKEAQATQSESSKDQAHAFDFLVGEWEMALTRYDQEGAELETRTTRSLVRRSAGGSALLDEWLNEGGLSVRIFSPKTAKWRFFRTDNQSSVGRLQFWEGRFKDGVGTFVGGDSLPNPSGRIRSKIIFADISEDAFHWEMHLSTDGGQSFRLTDTREYRRVE